MPTIHKRRLVSGEIVWELTHGTGANRQRFTAGKTREEAQEVLNQFNRQLALHGEGPTNDDIDAALGRYGTFLQTNRRHSTFRRYQRVLKTFHRCFLEVRYPEVRSLRQIKPFHVEEYKNRRIDGSIEEADDDDTKQREATLLAEARGHRAPIRQHNAKFGWLGRKKLQRSITPRTVNYELRVLSTFFRWAITKNHLFVDPTTIIERFRIPKKALPSS